MPVAFSATSNTDAHTEDAKLANLAHSEVMNTEPTELSVADARDHFSQRVNRAAFGDEITYVT